MPRRFHRKNHERKRAANRVNRGVCVPKRQETRITGIQTITDFVASEKQIIAVDGKAKEKWKPPVGILSHEQVKEVVSHIDLSGFISPIEIIVEYDYFAGQTRTFIKMKMVVNDRDTGFPIPLYSGVSLYKPMTTYESLVEEIKNCAIQMVKHEILEQFKIDGVRVYEPHPHGL